MTYLESSHGGQTNLGVGGSVDGRHTSNTTSYRSDNMSTVVLTGSDHVGLEESSLEEYMMLIEGTISV